MEMLLSWNVLQWVVTVIAFTGTLLNSGRNKWGFYFWLVSNTCLCIRNFVIGEYAQGVLFFLYCITAVRGIFVWTKQEREEKAAEAESSVEAE